MLGIRRSVGRYTISKDNGIKTRMKKKLKYYDRVYENS